jgi:hypothetical protein
MPRSALGLSRSQKNSNTTINKKESTITPTTQPSQVVHHNHQLEHPGFFSNMWQGFGLGAGQAIAHNIFRSDPVVKVENTSTYAVQSTQSTEIVKEYEKCLKDTYNDKEACKRILEML